MNTVVAKGKVLLAEPFMLDHYFRRSVIFLCEHGAEGSAGFILNKPLDLTLSDVVSEFEGMEIPVFYGGPVQTNTLHYIHSRVDLLPDSIEVMEGIFWGGDYDKLTFLIEEGEMELSEVRFFLGYSGWSVGQLDDEMELGSWIVDELGELDFFDSAQDELWQAILKNKGASFSVLADLPEGKAQQN